MWENNLVEVKYNNKCLTPEWIYIALKETSKFDKKLEQILKKINNKVKSLNIDNTEKFKKFLFEDLKKKNNDEKQYFKNIIFDTFIDDKKSLIEYLSKENIELFIELLFENQNIEELKATIIEKVENCFSCIKNEDFTNSLSTWISKNELDIFMSKKSDEDKIELLENEKILDIFDWNVINIIKSLKEENIIKLIKNENLLNILEWKVLFDIIDIIDENKKLKLLENENILDKLYYSIWSYLSDVIKNFKDEENVLKIVGNEKLLFLLNWFTIVSIINHFSNKLTIDLLKKEKILNKLSSHNLVAVLNKLDLENRINIANILDYRIEEKDYNNLNLTRTFLSSIRNNKWKQ